jgi:hypothetical protein
LPPLPGNLGSNIKKDRLSAVLFDWLISARNLPIRKEEASSMQQALPDAHIAQASSMNALQADRRRHPRYACDGHAEVFLPHGALLFQGKLVNLSLSGCLIETPALNLERGTHVEVYFVTRQIQCRLAGHLAVINRKGVAGIAFQDPGPRRARQGSALIDELRETSQPMESPALAFSETL